MKPVIKTCDNCGKEFPVVHKKRLEQKNLFCCVKCRSEFLKKQTLEKSFLVCPVCGIKFHKRPSDIEKDNKHQACCSMKCLAEYRKKIYLGDKNPNYGNRGSKNPIWKSDKKISPFGYVLIRVDDHPFKNCDGFVFEHRLIAEQYLLTKENSIEINGKRYLLPNYVVHHKDGNKQNNNVENLEIMTLAEHTSYHNKNRKLAS